MLLMASSRRSIDNNQRGDSGMNGSPTRIMTGTMSCSPVGMSHDAFVVIFCVALLTTDAINWPTPIHSCNVEAMAPRSSGGAHSDS